MNKESKPDIIYVVSDQHRGQAMAHMGDVNLRTPNLDALANEGASFERAYANCPVCTPSRGTIFSGRHAHAGPVQGFWNNWTSAGPSTATILRQHGYHTAYFGKWHCGIVRDQVPRAVRDVGGGGARTPERHRAGFQDWNAYECINRHNSAFVYRGRDTEPTMVNGYETDGLTDMAVEYLDEYDRDNPLFLVLSPNPPHFPFTVPEQWMRFDPEELEVRPNFPDNDPKWRETLAIYYAMIENLDWNIGRLREALARRSRETILVYTSDHGEFLGSHGHLCAKEEPHEESIRVPAVFHCPGRIPAQGKIDGLFSLVDLLSTTLGLIGIEQPQHLQGTDFSPALRGMSFQGPDRTLIEMVGNPRWRLELRDWRGLVTNDWKYAFYETGDEVLFDLRNDPWEKHNLAREQPEQREKMRQMLLEELARTREPYFDVVIQHGTAPDLDDIDVAAMADEL